MQGRHRFGLPCSGKGDRRELVSQDDRHTELKSNMVCSGDVIRVRVCGAKMAEVPALEIRCDITTGMSMSR